jgi:hypothetical protein
MGATPGANRNDSSGVLKTLYEIQPKREAEAREVL